MKDKKFLDEEINAVSEFVLEAKEIPMVEAVYCVPYIETKTKQENCSVVVVYNYSKLYRCKISEGSKKEVDIEEMKKGMNGINELCEKYNSKMEGKGFLFSSEDSSKYISASIDRRNLVAKKDLISGKLLFDRFGDIKQEQVNIVKCLKISLYTNLSDIKNIEEVKQKIKEK